MKFTKKMIASFLVILLLTSHVINSSTEMKIKNNELKSSFKNNANSRFNKIESDTEPNATYDWEQCRESTPSFNIFIFISTALSRVFSTFIDDVTDDIKGGLAKVGKAALNKIKTRFLNRIGVEDPNATETNPQSTTPLTSLDDEPDEHGCENAMESAYRSKIRQYKQAVATQLSGQLQNAAEFLTENFHVSDDVIAKLQENRNNPQQLCKVTRAAFKNKRSYFDNSRYRNVIDILEKCIERQGTYLGTLDYLYSKIENRNRNDSRNLVIDYVMYIDIEKKKNSETVYTDLELFQIALQNYRDAMVINKHTKFQPNTTDENSHFRKFIYSVNNDILDESCSDYPKDYNVATFCKHGNLLIRLKSFWGLLTDNVVKVCFKRFLDDKIEEQKEPTLKNIATKFPVYNQVTKGISKLTGWTMEKITSIIVNIFGAGAMGILKITYFLVKMLWNIARAVASKDYNEKSEFWGDAVGFGIKIIFTILTGGRKRLK